MTSVTSRFFELIRRNLKSDAVPRPPRQDTNKNEDSSTEIPANNEQTFNFPKAEEILIEDNDLGKDDHKPKSFFKGNKKKKGFKNSKPVVNDINDPDKNIIVNTQGYNNNIILLIFLWDFILVYFLNSLYNDNKYVNICPELVQMN